MGNSTTSIDRLLPLLEMVFQAENMKMAKVVGTISALNTQLADLNTAQSFDPMSIEGRKGADVLWEAWVENRKALINKQLADAAREREVLRETMCAALAKLEAAKQVSDKVANQARLVRERRLNW